MPMWRVCRLFVAVVVACVVGRVSTAEALEQGSSLASVQQDFEGGTYDRPPPNGLNGTSPSCFWAHGTQQVLRSMGSAALDQGAGNLPSVPMSLVSESCRHVLRSAVECALTPEQSVRDPVTGALYTGWWGLAPSWLGDALDTSGRRYVTACMVQRLNFYGTSVPILFEGAHPSITHSTAYDSQYPIEESTVFGDLFSSATPLLGLLPAFNVFVCWESLLPQSCGLLGLPLLEQRICDDAPLCGLLPVGPCALSCERSGPYWQCRPFLLAPPWTETVRVKLETSSCQ